MERFATAVSFSSKTIYYHFGQDHLNTSIIERYEEGLKSLGIEVDIWAIVSRKKHGYATPDSLSIVSEPPATPTRQDQAAEHLRRAAELLTSPPQAPVTDRDKGGA